MTEPTAQSVVPEIVFCPLCGTPMEFGEWAVADDQDGLAKGCFARGLAWRCPSQLGGCESILRPGVNCKHPDRKDVN